MPSLRNTSWSLNSRKKCKINQWERGEIHHPQGCLFCIYLFCCLLTWIFMAATEGTGTAQQASVGFLVRWFVEFLNFINNNLNEMSQVAYFQAVLCFSISTNKRHGRNFKPYFWKHLLTIQKLLLLRKNNQSSIFIFWTPSLNAHSQMSRKFSMFS